MTYTSKEVAGMVGLSQRQADLRLDTIATHLDVSISRGPRGTRVVTSSALELLRRVVTLERERGFSYRLAVEVVQGELGNGNGNGSKPRVEVGEVVSRSGGGDGEVQVLRVQVVQLEAENRRLWSQLDRVTGLLGEAQAQLALPRPREDRPRRRWWPFGRRASVN